MLILLNVNAPHFHGGWQGCEAFKLVEQANGTFDLVLTNDVARARENAEREQPAAE